MARRDQVEYPIKVGRNGYVGVEEKLREENNIPNCEPIERALLWKKARENKEGQITYQKTAEVASKIDKLMKGKEEGLITPCGSNDVLAMALGTDEHPGRVRV